MILKQKDLKQLVNQKIAPDITHMALDKVYELDIDIIGKSFGTYGMNGGLFKDRKTGELYAITSRNSNLFAIA